MSSRIGIDKTFEFLEKLSSGAKEVVEREEALTRQHSLKRGDAQRAHDEELERTRAQADGEIAALEAEHEKARKRIESRRESRRERIAQAQRSVKWAGFREIEEDENRGKGRVQKGLLKVSRERDAAVAETQETRAGFTEAISGEWEKWEELNSTAFDLFRGMGKFQNRLPGEDFADDAPEPDPESGASSLLESLRKRGQETEADQARYRRKLLPLFFRGFPVWLLVLLILLGFVVAYFLAPQFGRDDFTPKNVAIWCGASLGAVALLYCLGLAAAARLANGIVDSLIELRRALHNADATSEEETRLESERIVAEAEKNAAELQAEWKKVIQDAEDARAPIAQAADKHVERVQAKWAELSGAQVAALEVRQREALAELREKHDWLERGMIERHEHDCQERDKTYKAAWDRLVADWEAVVKPAYADAAADLKESDDRFPAWDDPRWADWSPPEDFLDETRFAHMNVVMDKLCAELPKDERLALPGGGNEFTFPFSLAYPDKGCLLLESEKSGREEMIGALNNIVLRLLANSPPGRISLTVADPVGLGQSFAGLMHLADHGEHLINGKIWTQTGQIEQRLNELNEHIEKVIQMYLRNEFETIADYNREAGNIAEKYHFLIVADFPVNFSHSAVSKLLSIAATGAKCGVYTLIHWDRRQKLTEDATVDDLRANSVCVNSMGLSFALQNRMVTGARFKLDPPPSPEFAIDLIHKIGKASVDSNRIEVPFHQVAPPPEFLWSRETTRELVVPIGRTGATKLQNLSIGRGTCQHTLIAGKTGSGKSTLFHVIVTNLALWCDPDQVEFYLIDFKKGVEFKRYATARLPHARVIAIESDREFGLSVLRRLDDELRERGELFRSLGAQDIAGYKRAGGTRPMPRTLLMVDEFQEYFIEDDKIAQEASLLLDRIVRQGRAFGMHVILGSQTLGGAFTLARATLGQMVIRIALQCNEADSYLILDDSNPAARMLTRPGEGIYNDSAGAPEGNHPFQIVWLSDEVRDEYLDKVAAKAKETGREFATPVVFEGNAPAEVAENDALRRFLNAETVERRGAVSAYLGAPNSIKGPTEAVFQRQSGCNLLVVGQRDEATLSMLAVSLISLAAQFPKDAARFVVLDGSPPESSERAYLERVVGILPHEVLLPKYGDLGEVLGDLEREMKSRDEAGGDPPARVFILIHGLQRFKKLRYEEDFSFSLDDDDDGDSKPGTALNNIIMEGAAAGIHVIASCDTLNNVNRSLNRKAITEFEMRVIFQMSANDSAALIDSPKGGDLGLHRALLYNEQEGRLETFRPYALPEGGWLEEAAGKFAGPGWRDDAAS